MAFSLKDARNIFTQKLAQLASNRSINDMALNLEAAPTYLKRTARNILSPQRAINTASNVRQIGRRIGDIGGEKLQNITSLAPRTTPIGFGGTGVFAPGRFAGSIPGQTIEGFGASAQRLLQPRQTISQFRQAPGFTLSSLGNYNQPSKTSIALDVLGAGLDASDIVKFAAVGAFATSKAAARRNAKKALEFAPSIEKALDLLKRYDRFGDRERLSILTGAEELARKVIPDLMNSKEFRKLATLQPVEYRNVLSKMLEDALVAGKTGDFAAFGLNTKPLRKSSQDALGDATKGVGKVDLNIPKSQPPKIEPPAPGKTLNQPSRPARAYDDIVAQPEVRRELTSTISQAKNPKTKVNFLDYIRTPDRVLKKIGLGKEANLLKQKYRDYRLDLPKEIDKITDWFKQVNDIPNSKQRIFKYLDGQEIQLSKKELKVADEMRLYLSEWADKLELPKDKRVTNYITHLFEDQLIQKEFDPELARLIEQSGVPGSVYDPFLQKRYGIAGYKEDVFQALDAYVKRATRKFHMDQALGPLKKASKKLDVESEKYVKRLGSRINLRPTEFDNLLDNLIKSSPIKYRLGSRPVANLSRRIRQMVYRGTLGLNIGSATRNLTQGTNTYAKLGEKYTIKGYLDLARKGTGELKELGILSDHIIQDRTLSSTKKFWQNLDNKLWVFFDWAEKVNRGSAYYGAKARALAKGASEAEAVKQGIKMVEDTQFTFGSVDTPVALQSDMVKFLTQFQSFNIKQTEFLSEMVKNKELGGMIRYFGANLAILYTVGKLFGMNPEDMIPFSDIFSEEGSRFGKTPPVEAVKSLGQIAFGGEGGREQGLRSLKKTIPAFIPGGVQAKKTFEGLSAVNEGASLTPTGRKRFDIEKTPKNVIKAAIFGQWSLPGAREYIDNLGKSKSSIVVEEFEKLKTKEEKAALWNRMVEEGKITKSNVSDIKKAFKDNKLDISKKEKSMRSLGVENGDRSRMIAKQLDKLKTKEEKAKLWNRYVELGIITKDVAKQLKAIL